MRSCLLEDDTKGYMALKLIMQSVSVWIYIFFYARGKKKDTLLREFDNGLYKNCGIFSEICLDPSKFLNVAFGLSSLVL